MTTLLETGIFSPKLLKLQSFEKDSYLGYLELRKHTDGYSVEGVVRFNHLKGYPKLEFFHKTLSCKNLFSAYLYFFKTWKEIKHLLEGL